MKKINIKGQLRSKVTKGGCNAPVVQRPEALLEPFDGSKFMRNLLRLNNYLSR